MEKDLYAHTPRKGSAEWHDLRQHLTAVAELAASFASKFGQAELGRLLGVTHDLAKADPRFQAYLMACHEGRRGEKCPHADASAVAAKTVLGPFSFAVVGHHTGMPDPSDVKRRMEHADQGSVKAATELQEVMGMFPSIRESLPAWIQDKSAMEMLTRMAFSCLVDADYLDTEMHFSPGLATKRATYPELRTYKELLDLKLGEFVGTASTVNVVRDEILSSCRAAANQESGAFRLTVPTGGGKTLSGMAFALDHALANGQDRVIVAIPYTSIIDQNAVVLKDVFGEGAVLEHHSSLDNDPNDEGQGQFELERRLAAENWDCPVIVTTTVQLFESLLHNKPSRCRKLHNIARSVIVLDEVQTLPPKCLGPVLDVLKELVEHYGCSVVFCTATQPDYSRVDNRLLGNATEIVPDYPRHFEQLKRVEFRIEEEPWTVSQVADAMAARDHVLTVVNTRKDALAIARELKNDGSMRHLSTLLCGHHRKRIITEVKELLREKEPIRLVSTQVIEAGVDVDFPVVMRDLGPLDRIIQVAGRCNREGRLEGLGECIVFRLEGGSSPRGAYRTAVGITNTLLAEFGDRLDSPESMRQFTREFYRAVETGSAFSDGDRADVDKLRKEFAFESVAKSFRLIDQDTTPIIVEAYPFVDVGPLIDAWKESPGGWFRRVAPYTVSVYRHELTRLQADGYVRSHESGAWLYSGPYDQRFGISPDVSDPTDLMA